MLCNGNNRARVGWKGEKKEEKVWEMAVLLHEFCHDQSTGTMEMSPKFVKHSNGNWERRRYKFVQFQTNRKYNISDLKEYIGP